MRELTRGGVSAVTRRGVREFTRGGVREFNREGVLELTGAGELFKELTGDAAAVSCVRACRYP